MIIPFTNLDLGWLDLSPLSVHEPPSACPAIWTHRLVRWHGRRRQPKGSVHPLALKVLSEAEFPAEGMRSKSWSEFAEPGAPVMDFVFTVRDSTAGETCPFRVGQPTTAHWGIEDPAAVDGTEIEKERALVTALRYLRNRIAAFTALPVKSLDEASLQSQLREIGGSDGSSSPRKGVA